ETVKTAQRIIQEQHIRFVDERAGECQATPFAGRERAHVAPTAFLEPDHLQQRVDGNLAYLFAESARTPDELEVLLGGEPVVQHRFLGNVANAIAHGSRAADGVIPMDHDTTGCRAIQACQQAQQHGLSRPICTRDAKRMAWHHCERHVVQYESAAKAAHQVVDDHGRLGGGMRDWRSLVFEWPSDWRVETHLMAPTAVTSRRLRRTSRTVDASDASRV